MTKDEAHNLECARAALGLRIERAKKNGNRQEAKEMSDWLREIERGYESGEAP